MWYHEGMWAVCYVLFTCGASQTPESELKLGCFAETVMVCGCPGLTTPEGKDSQHSWEEGHPWSQHLGASIG